MRFFMLPHPLTNFEMQEYYQNELRFNFGAYVINLDEYTDIGTHWLALFCKRSEIVYFEYFDVERVPEEIK